MSMTAGERRIVSVLISDVVDSTSIAETLGPDRSKYLFDDIVRVMREEVERFGGTVAQLTGDGVLALFGAPLAHEDDTERAVRAALAIREALGRYAEEVAPSYGFELGARVGVNTGPVVVPEGNAPPHILYNALGDTVNVAARLQALGDLVVGPTTARQIEELFELEKLGDLNLKGKSESIAAFRVTGIREHTAAHPEPPLLGREEDLAALRHALYGLLDGKGAIVSITGEPGIGKSRLVDEVERLFDGRVRFLAGHSVAYAETIPYWPVRELLRTWLGLGVSDAETLVRLELRAKLDHPLGEDAQEAYPFLASLLGLPLEPEQQQRIRDFAPDSVQHQTFDWLYRLMCALAGERPLCLVLDDLHWSDDATLSLLEELLPSAEQHAIAFLLVHRSDPEHPAWRLVDRARRRFRHRFFELELEPLLDKDTRAVAEADAGGELPDELALLLAQRTGGNPYFVGEAIRDLRERGALELENGRVLLVGDASIPAALQEALQARLDRLDAEARELVTAAAVIGRSFGLPLLERLVPGPRLLATLSELQWLQLVVQERSGAAPEYRFRHGLVQEVAYGTLVESRRRALHQRVGEALVELHRDSPAEVYGLLAHHFAQADELERALEYLMKAGDAARAVYADDEAIELYRQALGFMKRMGDEASARETLLKIALTHHLAFNFHDANEVLTEAFAEPAPAPVRLEPSETLTWAMPTAWDRGVAPGISLTDPSFQVTRNLFRGLLAMGPDYELQPDLAEGFTVSDDGRSYRFTLRRDAVWSDGVPVTASDFAFTFARMVKDDVATASWLDGVEAKSIDERTLDIQLPEPRNDFLYLLTHPPLFAWPQHVYERDGRDWHRSVPLVGSGPFVLTNRDEHSVELAASSSWYGTRGNVREVKLQLEASAEVAAGQWRRGAYDVLHSALAFQAVADDETVIQRSPGQNTFYLGFIARRPPLDDARIRRALAHAIDRHRPAELMGETVATTGGVIPPTTPGHSHRVAPAYDPDRARALLAEAGHPGGRGLGEIVLACLDLWEDATADVAVQLERIGVPVRLVSVTSDPDLEAAIEDQAHAYIWSWGEEYPDTARGFLELFYLDELYHDEELKGLLARAASLRDEDERLRTYREFERIWIGERAAVVPICYGECALWRRPWVTGMWVNATEISTFAHAVIKRPPSG